MHRIAVIADAVASSQQLIAGCLVKHGVEVRRVHTAAEAVREAEKDLAQLIVVSTGLPDLSPEKIAVVARASGLGTITRLVLVFSSGEEVDCDDLESKGFNGFLGRPLTEPEVELRLAAVMGEEFLGPLTDASEPDAMPTPMAGLLTPIPARDVAPDAPTDAYPAILDEPPVASEDDLTPLPDDALALLRKQVDEAEDRLQAYSEEDLSIPMWTEGGPSTDDQTVVTAGGAGGPRRRPAPWFDDLVTAAVDRRMAELLRPGAPLERAIEAAIRRTLAEVLAKARNTPEAQ